MYNTNTATVKRNLTITALTSDTLYTLAEILKGNRYANLQFTDAEAKDIEQAAYIANMCARNHEAAWIRFCELLTDGERYGFHNIDEETADRLSSAYQYDRYEVRTFNEDGDNIEENTYSTQEEAINAAKERIREAEEDNKAIRIIVVDTDADKPLYEADSTGTAYRLFEDYGSPILGAVVCSAEEAAQALNDWLCDSYEGEEAYKETLDECNEMVTIGSLSYYPSIALERIDPTAYRCGLIDWADAEYKDALYEIERMEYGDTVSRYGWNCKLVHIAEEIDYTADNSGWAVCR